MSDGGLRNRRNRIVGKNWDDQSVHRRCWAASGADAHMEQANPYTIATGSFGDVLRKYRTAWSNTDDVPAKWEDIPNNIQKHNLESLGKWLTNVSGYVGLVRWAKSRSITLKGNHESVEHWWNRLRRASQIEVWHFANYRMA